MANTKFTKEQQQAIDTRGCDLLVAAAAGSGKTAVLVERIIKIITNDQKPIDIDRLLVVTFTDAAASEMRQRISTAILKKIEENPHNKYLNRQFVLLNKASITTIHSFCKGVVKQNFHVLDIDPSFRIADTTEVELLKEEIIHKLFEEEYEKDNNNIFLQLVEIYGDKYTDNSLQSLVLQIYDFASSNPYPKQWLEEHSNRFNITDYDTFERSIWVRLLKDYIAKTLEGVILSANEAIYLCNLPNGPVKYIETINNDIDSVNFILSNLTNSFDKIHNSVCRTEFSKLKTITKKDNVNLYLQNRVKNIRDKEIKDIVNSLKDQVFYIEVSNLHNNIKSLYPFIEKLKELTLRFLDVFSVKKKEKNILDFNDLEHFCIKAISNKEVLDNLQSTFIEIFIDEYQDSNLTQEIILSSIIKKPVSTRFMVGDIKQSIYKFRGAKPELFLEKYNNFSKSDNQLKIDLSKNFRSRDIVINGINFIFKQIMSKDLGDIDYDNNASLHYGSTFPDKKNHNISEDIEIILAVSKTDELETKEGDNEIESPTNLALEAKLIANRILEITTGNNKLYVNDNGNYRAARYRDIVILTRTMHSVGEVLVEELKNYGIPAFAETSTGYFQNIEVMIMVSLMHIVDNPRQDIHLITVLKSPIYNLSTDDLLKIRSKLPLGTFYDCITSFILDKYEDDLDKSLKLTLKTFIDDLSRWRKISTYTPISNLVSILFQETKYFDYVSAMPRGKIRQANLLFLEKYAQQYEATSYKGLFHFIRYIEKVVRRNTQIGDAKITSENEDVVRIMSIHKSKGLEFPIVFVSMLGKKFNIRDESKDLILHKDYGFGPKYIDLTNRLKTNTIANFTLSNKIHEENFSEELRVLYVALTRAKEKLILTGCLSNLKKSLEKWSRFISIKDISLPYRYILASSTFLDFIMPCVLRHNDGKKLLDMEGEYLAPQNSLLLNDKSQWSINIKHINDVEVDLDKVYSNKKSLSLNLDELITTVDTSVIDNAFKYIYPFDSLVKLPTTISISEIKKNHYKVISATTEGEIDLYNNIILKEPNFLKEKRGLTSSEIGTLMHTVMEFLDLKAHTNKNSVLELLDNLIIRNIITRDEKKYVKVDKILKFINSNIGKKMSRAKYIKKETPFAMFIPAKETYIQNSSHKVMVHGIIDCFFEEDNGNIVLVDYKSDFVTSSTLESIKEKYEMQLSLYKRALENVTNKKVCQSIIYLFAIDDYIEL